MTSSTHGQSSMLGGVVDQTRVTLSIHRSDVNAGEVTALMGVEPTRTAGAWILEINADAPEDPEAAIARLLAMLPPGDGFWADLNAKFRIDLSLMLVVKAWKRGFQLSPSVANELARRGLALSFEVYAEPQQMASACFA